jgi:plasmid maintenance system antidote protein VapI
MNVSAQQINKIVKGKQNLTFETIGKLEDALGISLIEIIDYKPTMEIKTSTTQIQFVSKNVKNKKISKVLQKQ